MRIDTWIHINEDKVQKQFLRENSHWYKYLNRSNIYYKEFIDNMKKQYKLTPTDKLNKMISNINLISSFLEAIK